MEIIFLLIPLSILFVIIIAGVLFWAIRSGQYDDLEKEGHRILMEEDEPVDDSTLESRNETGAKRGQV